MSYELNRMRSQLADLAEQHHWLQAELELERTARIETQAEMALAAHNVNQPRQLSKLLQTDGTLVEQNGELQLRTPQGVVSIEEGLPQLLKTPDYEHYRPSTFSSKGNPSAAAPAKPVGRFLQGGDRLPTDAEIHQALRDPTRSELFRELEESLGQPAPQPVYESTTPQPANQPVTNVSLPSDEELALILANPTRASQLYARVEGAG